MCADRLADDYNYEWENRPDDPNFYYCDKCGDLTLEDDLVYNEKVKLFVCPSCNEGIENGDFDED